MEGYNGYAKDNARAALGAADKRRIRGIAAATVFAALALMATNLRKIQTFLDDATEQADGTVSHPKPRARRRTQDKQDLLDKLDGAPPPVPTGP